LLRRAKEKLQTKNGVLLSQQVKITAQIKQLLAKKEVWNEVIFLLDKDLKDCGKVWCRLLSKQTADQFKIHSLLGDWSRGSGSDPSWERWNAGHDSGQKRGDHFQEESHLDGQTSKENAARGSQTRRQEDSRTRQNEWVSFFI